MKERSPHRRSSSRKWTEDEISFLKGNYRQLNQRKLARTLHRSVESIRAEAYKLGITYKYDDKTKTAVRLLRNLKETDWAYMAGLIDGEGSIAFILRRSRSRGKDLVRIGPFLSISNSSTLLLEWAKENFKFHVVKKLPKGSLPQRKPNYQVALDGMSILPILEGHSPYLKLKKEQCTLVIGFIKRRKMRPYRTSTPYTSEDVQDFLKVKELNIGSERLRKWLAKNSDKMLLLEKRTCSPTHKW